jgi:hypothetical protein
MYRVKLADGELQCAGYKKGSHGIDLLDDFDDTVAFVPYDTLVAVVDDGRYSGDPFA